MCKDPSISYLNELGFYPVSFPREDIEPLDVVLRESKCLKKIGLVSKLVFQTEEKLPVIKRDNDATDISGKRSNKLDLKIGIQFLDQVLSAIGAKSLGLDAAFSKVKTLEFHYENVKVDAVEALDIEKYLRNSVPDIKNLLIEQMDEEDESYIISETLKSNSFGITAYDEKGYAVKMTLSNLQQFITLNPDVKVTISADNTISFKGDKMLRFAVSLSKMWISVDPISFRFEVSPEMKYAAMKGGSETIGFAHRPLVQKGAFIRIK
jgi:hypothetical protein